MTTTRRVFVIWMNPLFHESVRLLLSHPDVEWVGATSDHAAAHEQIMKLRADTILIEEGEGGGVPGRGGRNFGSRFNRHANYPFEFSRQQLDRISP